MSRLCNPSRSVRQFITSRLQRPSRLIACDAATPLRRTMFSRSSMTPLSWRTRIGASGVSGGSGVSMSVRGVSGFSYPAPRKLDEIVKLPLFEREDAKGIERVWTEHHSAKDSSLGLVLTATDAQTLATRAKQSPIFVLPVFQTKEATTTDSTTDGSAASTTTSASASPSAASAAAGVDAVPPHWVMVTQVQDAHILFTALAQYQVNPATAPPYLAATIYSDLTASKGLALVRGDICHPMLTKPQAGLALRLLLHVYLHDEHYPHLIETFNHRSNQFNWNGAIAQLHRLQTAIAKAEEVIEQSAAAAASATAATTANTNTPRPTPAPDVTAA